MGFSRVATVRLKRSLPGFALRLDELSLSPAVGSLAGFLSGKFRLSLTNLFSGWFFRVNSGCGTGQRHTDEE